MDKKELQTTAEFVVNLLNKLQDETFVEGFERPVSLVDYLKELAIDPKITIGIDKQHVYGTRFAVDVNGIIVDVDSNTKTVTAQDVVLPIDAPVATAIDDAALMLFNLS